MQNEIVYKFDPPIPYDQDNAISISELIIRDNNYIFTLTNNDFLPEANSTDELFKSIRNNYPEAFA